MIERRRCAGDEVAVRGAIGNQRIGVVIGDEVVNQFIALVERIGKGGYRAGKPCAYREPADEPHEPARCVVTFHQFGAKKTRASKMPRVGKEFNLIVLCARFGPPEVRDDVAGQVKSPARSDARAPVEPVTTDVVGGDPRRLIHRNQYGEQPGEERLADAKQQRAARK